MKFILAPPSGYRTYRLMLASLLLGTGLAVLGILKGVDLISLGVAIGTILTPVTGFSAMNNRGTGQKDDPPSP